MAGFGQAELRCYYDEPMELIGRKQATLAPDILKVPVTDHTDRDCWEREAEFLGATPSSSIRACLATARERRLPSREP